MSVATPTVGFSFTTTATPGNGNPSSAEVTVPDTFMACANPVNANMKNIINNKKCFFIKEIEVFVIFRIFEKV